MPKEIKKDLAYYWRHPKEYPRMKLENLNSEAAVNLCEIVARGLRDEMDKLVAVVNRIPEDEGTVHKVCELKRNFETPYIQAITFGHSDELVSELVERCPEGVFGNDDNRTNEGMARKQFNKSERNGTPVGHQRVATGSD